MPRFAANLTMMFTELPFLDRFSAAADQGFQWVEYLFPYEFAPEDLACALERNRLKQALFNLPPGDWTAGERGLACLPGREKEFDDAVEKAVLYAQALNCPRLHAMAGVPIPSNLASLRDKAALHQDVIDKDAILSYVLQKVSEKTWH